VTVLTHRIRRLPLAVVALGVAAALGWWFSSPRAEDDAPAESVEAIKHDGTQLLIPERSPLRSRIELQTVSEQPITTQVELPAVVQAKSGNLVNVLPPIAGRIVHLRKSVGDRASAGETLFEIESGEVADALSDAEKADAALASSKLNIVRQRELASTSIAADKDVEDAQNQYEQAVSEATRTRSRLAQLGVVDRSLVTNRMLQVRSPISGSVVSLAAGEGAYWNDATAATMTIADLSSVNVIGSAQEKDLRHFYVGQDATVTLDAYPEQPQRGKVQYISESLDADTRTVQVRLVFDNRKGLFKPGMFARAAFRDRPRQGTVIPISAVIQSGFYSRTFVEVAPWRFESRVVELGRRFGDQVEVLSGLKTGERVVTKEGVLLNNG